MYRRSLFSIIFVLSCALIPTAKAANVCPCGYSVTSPTAVDRYTDVIETDFLHLSSIHPNPCWSPQVYNVSADVDRGAFGKSASLSNVVANPLEDGKTWTGDGIRGGAAGLQLWVDSVVEGGLLGMGEIVSKRKDVFYGSLRVGMKVTRTPGTCAGFFWYHDDEQEIDMELLSSNTNTTSNPVYLVMQSPQSALHGFNAQGTPTYEVAQLPFHATADDDPIFREYRFDWTADSVRYYADSVLLDTLDHMYASSNGSIFLNHWSNGNPLWSRGPPAENAVITISYIKAYFNSSDLARGPEFEDGCAAAKEENKAICQVPGYTPTGDGGERTHFFAHGMCGEGRGAGAGDVGSTSASKIADGAGGALRKTSNGDKSGASLICILCGLTAMTRALWW